MTDLAPGSLRPFYADWAGCSRRSILLRLINHEAYHLWEINLTLGANGREPIDPWPGREWEPGVPASVREG